MKKLIKLLFIYSLIGVTSYLWIIFFVHGGSAFSFISNAAITLIVFAFFVIHLSVQLVPRLVFDIKSRIEMAGISVLFIPLLIICFAHAYRQMGLEEISNEMDYIYFSVVTFTTLGYGDIIPSGTTKNFAILQAISGFLFVPLLISQLINTTRDAGEEYQRIDEENKGIQKVIDQND